MAQKQELKPLDNPKHRLFLTGASGLLGRAIMKHFISMGWEIYGTALSRAKVPLHYLDVTNKGDVIRALAEFKPSFVIHAAAERDPDKVDDKYAAAKMINETSTIILAGHCERMGVPMIYISTDYVFDGNSAPYFVNAKTCPVNLYGDTKVMGEKATLQFPGHLVLRVSVLYGPVETLSESAVTCLLSILMDKSKTHVVSNYERRRPVHVDDVANICYLLSQERLKNPEVSGIFHWCGAEELTKYMMMQKMAKVFQLNSDHVTPNNVAPPPDAGPQRPFDTTLDTSRIHSLFDATAVKTLPFESHIFNSLVSWVEEYRQMLSCTK